MFLQHGTDSLEAVEQWKSHQLQPSEFDIDNYEDYDDTGDVIESETQREFREKRLSDVVYLSMADTNYGQVARIHISVDDKFVVQVSDDEFVMDVNAPYTIENIEYSGKDYNVSNQSRDTGGRW